MQNLRVKYYREEDWISEMKLAQGMSEEFLQGVFPAALLCAAI